MDTAFKLPPETSGLQLARITKSEMLILCEPVVFDGGKGAVDMVLRRAVISGRVEVGGEIKSHFADVLDKNGGMIETVALDSKSYGSLKNHWMRCKVQRHETKKGMSNENCHSNSSNSRS